MWRIFRIFAANVEILGSYPLFGSHFVSRGPCPTIGPARAKPRPAGEGSYRQRPHSPILSHTLRHELRGSPGGEGDIEGEAEPDRKRLPCEGDGERKEAQHMRFNMIFNERAAVVYNFSPRYFAGLTLVMNNSVFDDDVVVVNQNKWRARAFVGLRL